MLPRKTLYALTALSLLMLGGCSSKGYVTPDHGVSLAGIDDADIEELFSKKPASPFPAQLSIVRVASTYRDGFEVVQTRDIESDADLARITEQPLVSQAAPLSRLLVPNDMKSLKDLRLPAALVFDHPSPSAVAGYLLERLAPAEAQGGADPVLNDLARLETALTTLTLEDTDANAVTARLEGLLTKWKAKRATNGGPTTAERLSEASKDQLLAFIDNELGVS